jgi:hypothetical protein
MLTLLPELLRFSVEQRYILFGLLLTAVIILRPEGLLTRGTWNRLTRFKQRDRGSGVVDRPNQVEGRPME